MGIPPDEAGEDGLPPPQPGIYPRRLQVQGELADQPGSDLLPPGGVLEEEEGGHGFSDSGMDVLRPEDRHPLPGEALDVRRPPFL